VAMAFGGFQYTLQVKNDTFYQESDKTYIYENLGEKEENSAQENVKISMFLKSYK
jgi:hypothetical protein